MSQSVVARDKLPTHPDLGALVSRCKSLFCKAIRFPTFAHYFFVGRPYWYTRQHAYLYRFVSEGKERIEKIAVFGSTPKEGLFNFGFGDLTEDGTIDYHSNSNNGDMIRTLATVIHILKDFITQHPTASILFTGSTPNRTKLYNRILKTYYSTFSKEFAISTLVEHNGEIKEVIFDPISANEKTDNLVFLIKKF